MRNLLILDWDPHYRAYVLDAARSLGAEVHLVMRATPDPVPDGVTEVHVLPDLYEDPLTHVPRLAEYARAHAVNGVFTHEDELMELGAALAEELGLPGPTLAAVRLCMDKSATRDRLKTAGVPGPGFRHATSLAEARAALAELELPVVLKPVAASGGQGVSRLTEPEALPEAWEWAASPYRYLPREYHRVLLEEYLDGPLVSVESVVVDDEVHVVTATDGLQTIVPAGAGQARFVYDGLLVPARTTDETERELRHWAREAVRALGIRSGVVHTEFKVTAQGVRVVEVNPRLPGVLIPELVHRALGVDLARAALQCALGERPDLVADRRGGACVRLVLAAETGEVRAVDGVREATAAPHVVRATVLTEPGARVAPPEQGDIESRLGYVLTEHGTGPHQALRAAEEALARISVRVAAPSPAA
ncbi:ATP-grasp domain-containing protein [Streptomyces paradoxus]|uniref:ATP-grasp domain-containing protein n=1 Tax=Streptomyces paradoxus TaxID=66375 RepID=UPI00380552E8